MKKGIYDPRIPATEEFMLVEVLERRAKENPDKLFALFEDGSSWTYSEMLAEVKMTARGLKKFDVKEGDFVAVWLPNGPDVIRLWFAINYLGAVFVPIHLALRGNLLEHCLTTIKGELLLTHAELMPRLSDINLGTLKDIVVYGGECNVKLDVCIHQDEVILHVKGSFPEASDRKPWDTQMVIFTSGTTGPSKAVLISYMHLYSATEKTYPYFTEDDRFLSNLPLSHISGIGTILTPLLTGGSFAMVSAFNTNEFWNVVERTQSTMCTLMGAMAGFLLKEPITEKGRFNSLRTGIIVPLSIDPKDFSKRFGCNVYTAFNMSETSTPLISELNPSVIGTCGKPREGVEVRLVDENDCEVSSGQIGELIIRTDRPWGMSQGYLGNPEATAKAWRNGWFHTGDAFRQDEQGNYYYVDRIKDSIRRRGENISSFEVEAEVGFYPKVREVAAIAVPSEDGEDEVFVAISLIQGATMDPAELILYLIPRMPHYMVPRYVRILDELPKTPSLKVKKHLLRDEGITDDTFDRVSAGIIVKREKVGEEQKH